MATKAMSILTLSDLLADQEADLFLLLSAKEELKTRDGKPYFKVTFRDAGRELSFPIWSDSAWAVDCRQNWAIGEFYKVRAIYRETNFVPQLDIKKIRRVTDADVADGFDPLMCVPQSRFSPSQMFDDMLALARERIADAKLRDLLVDILLAHRETLLKLPAATRNHHAFLGGYLEHVLSVAQTAAMLADKYDMLYPDLRPRLNKDLVVAGALLHDIGKLREIEQLPHGAQYTAAGHLIGHLVQGRDIIREAATGRDLPPDVLLRLEHIILSHQRLPEWGSPKPPMTPEALIVHYADDLDAKYQMMYAILRDEPGAGSVTSKKNVLYQSVYRGSPDEAPADAQDSAE